MWVGCGLWVVVFCGSQQTPTIGCLFVYEKVRARAVYICVCVCVRARARACVCVCAQRPRVGSAWVLSRRLMARVLRWRGFPGWVTRVHGWPQRFAGVCGLLFGFVLSFSFSHLLEGVNVGARIS